MKYPRFYQRFSQGEMAVKIDVGSLGELCQQKRRSAGAYHRPNPPKISSHCSKGKHPQCFKANCTCRCHRRGA